MIVQTPTTCCPPPGRTGTAALKDACNPPWRYHREEAGESGRRCGLPRAVPRPKYGQPGPPAPLQPVDGVEPHEASQPAGPLPADHQYQVVVVVTMGLGTDGMRQVLATNQTACLMAERLQMLHRQVQAMLSDGVDIVVRSWCYRELSHSSAKEKLHRGQPRPIGHQRQHHHLARLLLARLLLMPFHEVVDRLQIQLRVEFEQIHIKDEQIALHLDHFLPRTRDYRARSAGVRLESE
jgi:hypothetical protein